MLHLIGARELLARCFIEEIINHVSSWLIIELRVFAAIRLYLNAPE